MKIYKSTKFSNFLFPLMGGIISLMTFGLGFHLFYDIFFNHEDWVNSRRLNKFLTNNDCYKIERYSLDTNSDGFLDLFLTTKLKFNISHGKWSLWNTNGYPTNRLYSVSGDLLLTDQSLSYSMRRIKRKITFKINKMIFEYYDSIENKIKYKCGYYLRNGILFDTFCGNNICNKSLDIKFDESCYCISGNIYVDWTKDIILKEKFNYLSKDNKYEF